MTIETIVERLMELKKKYYNGEEEISDREFDDLEDKLREMDPNNDYFNKVGYEIDSYNNDKTLVTHSVPMLSMDKVKTPEQAKRWMSAVYLNHEFNANHLQHVEWNIQPKIDGNSCTIKYDKNGRFMYIATRGDGNKGFVIKYGEDIMKNNNLPFILYQPNSEDSDIYDGCEIELRGELYINQNNTEIKPPLRNACAGIIKRIDRTIELNSIKVCLYSVVNSTYKTFISYGDKFPETIDLKQTIIPYSTKCKIDDIDKIYDKYLNKVRLELPFETDGLVIYYPNENIYTLLDQESKDKHHHHYNMALKPVAKGSESYIKNIVYNISKYGTLIPKAIIDPITIDNVVISTVTLTNFDQITSKNLKIGSKVVIERANDVIPFLKEVIGEFQNAKPIVPIETCPICNGRVIYSKEDKNLICLNPKCKGKLISQILFFVEKLKIKGLAEKSIEKILDSPFGIQIYCICDFFRIFTKEREYVRNLLGVNYEKILLQVLEAFDKVTIKELIAYGAMIPSVGLKTIENEDIKDIYVWFKNIQSFTNGHSPAWKQKTVRWMENEDNYNHFIDLYLFLTDFKLKIKDLRKLYINQ